MQAQFDKPDFIPHLHAFRGLAILAIVGAHCWSLPIFWTGDLDTVAGTDWVFGLTETLFHGSTLYFALISGLLFSRVLAGRGWPRFFKSRALNVALPYLFLTVLFTVVFWSQYLSYATKDHLPTEFLPALLRNILFGAVQVHFWYIPILLVLFLLTPLLHTLSQRAWGQGLLWLLAALPLVVSRTTYPDFVSVKSLVFFLGAYSLGMLAGCHHQRTLAWIARWRWLLALVAVTTSVCLYAMYLHRYTPSTWIRPDQSLFYLQKISIAALCLYALYRIEDRLPRLLMLLGHYAFAIYFLHILFFWGLIGLMTPLLQSDYRLVVVILFGPLLLISSVALSMLLSRLIIALFGKRSRWLIGV